MKTFFTLLFSLVFLTNSFSQSPESCVKKDFNTAEEVKSFDPCALSISEYILKNPISATTSELNSLMQSKLFIWMEKTPDYTFTFNSTIMKVFDSNKKQNLFVIYLAALSKAALSNTVDFHKEGVKYLVEYILDEKNGVTITGPTKKLIAAYKAGDYKEYYKE